VALSSNKKYNAKLARKVKKVSDHPLGRMLYLVGYPLYKIIELTVIIFLTFSYLLGKNARLSSKFIYKVTKGEIDKFTKWYKNEVKRKKKSYFLLKNSLSRFSKIKYLKAFNRINKNLYKRLKIANIKIYWNLYLLKTKAINFGSFKLFKQTKKQKPVKITSAKRKTKPGTSNAFKLLLLNLKLKFIRLQNIRIDFPTLSIKKKIIIFSIFLFSIPIALLALTLYDLPTPYELTSRKLEVSTKIYDRNGVLLFNIYKDKNRSVVKLDQIPLHVRLATIAAEDAEFYTHPGFSIKGISRALFKNVSEGKLSGGSTITQQLIKNALLSSEKTVRRKVRELVLSVWTEMVFSKDQILEMYMNEVAYGGTAYGIEEASQTYFGKSVSELTLSEAALLAGLPKSPTKFSPFGPNPDLAIERQREVLHLMKVNGYISEEQETEALKYEPKFAANRIEIKAPHFVMYERQNLEDFYGKELVESGGLEVTTTLDYNIQRLAEDTLSNELDKLKALNVTNGAAIVMDAQSGEILAMVGSKNFFDIQNDGNVNVTTQPRQPGSSIKVVNYAYALSHGFTPASILSDTPITYAVQGQPPYTPKNYDGAYRGNLTLRSALAESRNIPAVKVLASYGVRNMLEMGKQFGITTWEDTNRFGLSLTLGGGEVKLLELARVYATIANYGVKPDVISTLSVKNFRGKEIFESECTKSNFEVKEEEEDKIVSSAYAAEAKNDCMGERVLDERVAYLLTDILKDNDTRSPAFGRSSALVIPNHPEVAVKTGTSNNLRDNLTVGYNQKYVVAVWVGNNDNTPMARVASGVTGASPIFQKIMSALLDKEPSLAWSVPQGVSQKPICMFTGTLPCDGCPTRLEWFLNENSPQFACKPEVVKELTQVNPHPQILSPAQSIERVEIFN